ncbi:MAG: PHB depolymerase family esterase, partial [Xanthobacteraceae bacterium]|nr:PHB depolymerase family esterase [Xanthobacteraceae bacterium]
SWFLRGDTVRGQGEALSIREMVDHAIAKLASDRRKVFVTGLSAGGAMASVMLATYPEIFAGGAILAGLPHGCASNVQQAFEAMFTDQGNSPQVLGDRVRAASKHCGPWPKISVWHGTADPIVKPSNSESIIRQWTNVHGLSDKPSYQKLIDGHTLNVWTDASGEALIEAFSVSNMAHGVPLATTGRQSCGNAGSFFLDVGISSTHHIARFWGLDQSIREVLNEGAAASAPTDRRTLVIDGAMIEGSYDSSSAFPPEDPEDDRFPTSYPVDPNGVIAAAFKAAGLAVPKSPTTGSLSVAPGPIIAAALKAAGMIPGVPDDG